MLHKNTVPTPPKAWLVVRDGGAVIGVFPSRDDPELLALVKEKTAAGRPLSVMLDNPSLKITYHDGIYVKNPSCLAARDNWFHRYESVLEDHLRDPRVAQVYTFSPGKLTDPLATHKSSKQGPFPFPKGKPWPQCGFCNLRLGFVGVLDFRDYSAVQVPHGSLALHVCPDCSFCSDCEAWAVTWIKEGEEVQIMGDVNREVLLGRRWDTTEYPTPAIQSEELTKSGPFLSENSIFCNFSSFADKVGGRVYWIQGEDRLVDENSFVSETGEPMTYIGQFIGTPDMEIGDSGIAYLLYSPKTGETIMYPQSF